MSQLKKYILGQVQEGKLSPTDAKEMILELSDSEYGTSEIAIIGISGKFPGARNLDEFWDNLRSGICSIDKIPLNRLEDLQGKVDTENKVLPCGGFLDEIDKFDPAFFRISPKEALYAYSGTSGRLFRRHPDTKPELSGHLADRFDFTVTIPKLQYCGIV